MTGAVLTLTGQPDLLPPLRFNSNYYGTTATNNASYYDFGGFGLTGASGGSGSYSYLWTETDDGKGLWSAGGPPDSSGNIFINVANVGPGVTTTAYYTLNATDLITGQKGATTPARFIFTHQA